MKKIPILFLGLLGGLAACTRIPPAIAPDKKIETRIGELLQKMTLEEKIGQMCQLTAGVVIDQSDPQHPVLSEALLDTVIGRYKVGSILNIPFGVGQPREVWIRFINRIQQRSLDELGIPCIYGVDQIHGASYTQGATLFPQGINMGASFNRGLMRRCSEISAYETRACAIPWTFAPVMDLGRDPRWPRMWESYGEDTYVNSQMAVASVLGFQGEDPNRVDDRHVAACIKHFMAYGVPVSGKDRTPSSVTRNVLREKYFAPFMECIRAGALSLMVNSASNGGMPFHADRELLTGWIKEELDWDGLIVTDWNDIYNLCERDHIAASRKDAVRIAVNAGIDMSMVPSSWDFCIYLRELVEEGQVSMERIDDAVSRVLRLKFRLGLFEKPFWDTGDFPEFASDEYAAVALQAAVESEILLKNEDGILPLKAGEKLAVIGDFAQTPRYQGAGSSAVNALQVDALLDCIKADGSGIAFVGYASGFDRQGAADPKKQEEAVSLAKQADTVLLCLGLDELRESEGLDRADMALAENQQQLLDAVAAVNPNVVVLLSAGAPVETPWVGRCKALVYGALGGQAGAGAAADILTGKLCPCGKLSQTWAKAHDDTPAKANFGGEGRNVEYREGLYVGYRYYQTAGVKPAFPFGYGLSYTTFEYSDLKADEKGVTLTVTNTGSCAGAEIVQLYVAKQDAKVFRPAQELKGFAKVSLAPGESRTVSIALDDKAFRYWNVRTDRWEVEGGSYQLRVGASSADIRLTAEVSVKGTNAPDPYEGLDLLHYVSGQITYVTDAEFEALLGHPVPEDVVRIDRNMTLGEMDHGRSPLGWVAQKVLRYRLDSSFAKGTPDLNTVFQYNMPLRALAKMTNGMVSMGMVDGLVWELKGFWLVGILRVLYEFVKNLILNSQMENRLKNS